MLNGEHAGQSPDADLTTITMSGALNAAIRNAWPFAAVAVKGQGCT
jgi:hypothetical protein